MDENADEILNNSMISDRQNNENQNNSLTDSIFQNKISNILCN